MEENWKIVRNRTCIRAVMIFIGVILMQMLAYMVCMIVALCGAMFFDTRNPKALEKLANANTKDSEFLLMVTLVSAILSMIWCGILYRKSSWRERPFDYKKAFSVKNVLAILGSGAGGCIVLTMLLTALSCYMPEFFQSYNMTMERLTDSTLLFSVIYVLLIGPVSEELIFRGAILDRFYLVFPFLSANLLQAVLFGLYHGNVIQGLYAVVLGFTLGLVRKKTGSIISCMIMHIVFNATSYILGMVFPAKQIWFYGLIALLGAVSCVWSISFLWERKSEVSDK